MQDSRAMAVQYQCRRYINYILLYLFSKGKKRSERRPWVKPIKKERYLEGAYYILIERRRRN